MEKINQYLDRTISIDSHSSEDEETLKCGHCSIMESVIQEAVHAWLDEYGADLLSKIFIPKQVSKKKRKLNK